MDKKFIILIFVLTSIIMGFLILSKTRIVEESKVNWLHSFDEGLSQARAENKLVLIYFYADWCTWCDKLDQETYKNQEIASYLNEKLVCVKVNVEKNVSLSENYNVYTIPTTALLSSKAQEVGRIGYKSPVQFLEYVKDIVSQYG